MKASYKPLGSKVLVEWAVLRGEEVESNFAPTEADQQSLGGENDDVVLVLTDLGSNKLDGAEIGDYVMLSFDIPPEHIKVTGHMVEIESIIGKIVYPDDTRKLVFMKDLNDESNE
jgi:hypothetical protein